MLQSPRTPASPAASERDTRDRTGAIRGRGTAENPVNRFDRLAYEAVPDEYASPDYAAAAAAARPQTIYLRDPTRTVLAHNQSPDINFATSLNPYRGCEHGCVYCYARPTHEYLSFSAGLDFESRIMVKEDAPDRLREAFLRPRWRPQAVALSRPGLRFSTAEER